MVMKKSDFMMLIARIVPLGFSFSKGEVPIVLIYTVIPCSWIYHRLKTWIIKMLNTDQLYFIFVVLTGRELWLNRKRHKLCKQDGLIWQMLLQFESWMFFYSWKLIYVRTWGVEYASKNTFRTIALFQRAIYSFYRTS